VIYGRIRLAVSLVVIIHLVACGMSVLSILSFDAGFVNDAGGDSIAIQINIAIAK